MDEFLKQLAERLQIPEADIISADETADWATGKLNELVEAGVLAEIQHSKGVVCSECEENCFIEPNIRTNPNTDEATGVFVCTRNPDIGRIEIDIDRQRRWRINKGKLKKLGYCVETGPDPEDTFITVQQASKILNVDKGTISRLATEGKIKHNGETGNKRRISKLSILLLKDDREVELLMKDVDDLRKDIGRIPKKH